MMRLAVVNLTSGGLSGGYRKYLTRLMPLLASDRRIAALTVFVPEGAAIALERGIDLRTCARPERGWATLRRTVALCTPDVVFVPTARHFPFATAPTVVMVRNMEPLEVPFGGNTWTEGFKNVARAWEARRACRQAKRVIAVSDHVRQVVVSRWRLDEDRVGTVYHGVDDGGEESNGDRAEGGRTLFTAGSIRPARGLEDIIRALPMLDAGVQLVIAGRVDVGCERYAGGLRRLCATLRVGHRVTFAGQLDPAQMSEAFHRAAAFVTTSRAEACPNTALEAMSAGTASVSIDRPPMPEFFGDAALYYAAADPAALARQLHVVLSDVDERKRLGRRARRRAANFTWEATRDRTIDELERARS
jgi:glycosyltransferase involved in cell wall biosynthesis